MAQVLHRRLDDGNSESVCLEEVQGEVRQAEFWKMEFEELNMAKKSVNPTGNRRHLMHRVGTMEDVLIVNLTGHANQKCRKKTWKGVLMNQSKLSCLSSIHTTLNLLCDSLYAMGWVSMPFVGKLHALHKHIKWNVLEGIVDNSRPQE